MACQLVARRQVHRWGGLNLAADGHLGRPDVQAPSPVRPGSSDRCSRLVRDGKRIATARPGGGILLWDAQSGQRLARPLQRSPRRRPSNGCADGTTIAVGTASGGLEVWDDATLVQQFWIPPSPAQQLFGPAYSVAYSPRGDRFATGISQGLVVVWDGLTGAVHRAFTVGEGRVMALD